MLFYVGYVNYYFVYFKIVNFESIYEDYFGIVSMKVMVCSYVWWLGIDSDIEDIVCEFQQCYRIRKVFLVLLLFFWFQFIILW